MISDSFIISVAFGELISNPFEFNLLVKFSILGNILLISDILLENF